MRGRPSEYSAEIADSICDAITTRDNDGKLRPLWKICRDDEGMPSEASVYNWLRNYPDFLEKYARARELMADINADSIVEIADTEEDPNKARVRIDARKWWAGKVQPKKYGEKVALTDADGGKLVIEFTQ